SSFLRRRKSFSSVMRWKTPFVFAVALYSGYFPLLALNSRSNKFKVLGVVLTAFEFLETTVRDYGRESMCHTKKFGLRFIGQFIGFIAGEK
ncbi:hypothetical protein PFISCL1PPCAC_1689, partial [Pristionchus fissidentatus]